MRTSLRKVIGATLLEIMLVLAIAAFIIILSIRYYQSAQTSSGVEALEGAAQAMMSIADTMGLAAGTFASATTSNIWGALPASLKATTSGGINTPWGTGTMSATQSGGTSIAFKITPPTTSWPNIVCIDTAGYINNVAKARVSTAASCSGATLSWTYSLTSSQ